MDYDSFRETTHQRSPSKFNKFMPQSGHSTEVSRNYDVR